MLIWDEPEIHLHPEWQIVFCKLIIELVAKGIPIVVSSHSPYFVQALRYFASAKGIEKDVKYYMAEESNETKLSTVKEVTNDLNLTPRRRRPASARRGCRHGRRPAPPPTPQTARRGGLLWSRR